jgi:ABC-2 type transport system permease protein
MDFGLGYTLPALLIAFAQVVVCFVTAFFIGLAAGTPLSPLGVLLNMLSTVPAMFLFIGFGILFGSLFSDKAAPGVSSIIITLSGILSGAWMPIDPQSALGTVCSALPFYPAVTIGRVALSLGKGTFTNFWGYLLLVCIYAAVVFALSIVVFRKKTNSDDA